MTDQFQAICPRIVKEQKPLWTEVEGSSSPLSKPQYSNADGRGQLKCDDTSAETKLRLSAKRTSPFKSVGGVSSVDYRQPMCAHQLLLLVAMLDTPCSDVVRRVLTSHSIRQFPLHFPSRASPCAITFHLESIRFTTAS
jgi:hypothetical protein